MIRRDELTDPTSTLNKAHDEEPLFILRAGDRLAAQVVRYWIWLATAHGVSPAKVARAAECAEEMECWIPMKLPD